MKIAIKRDHLTRVDRLMWICLLKMAVLDECTFGLHWLVKSCQGIDFDLNAQMRIKVSFFEIHVQFSDALVLLNVHLKPFTAFMPSSLHRL